MKLMAMAKSSFNSGPKPTGCIPIGYCPCVDIVVGHYNLPEKAVESISKHRHKYLLQLGMGVIFVTLITIFLNPSIIKSGSARMFLTCS